MYDWPSKVELPISFGPQDLHTEMKVLRRDRDLHGQTCDKDYKPYSKHTNTVKPDIRHFRYASLLFCEHACLPCMQVHVELHLHCRSLHLSIAGRCRGSSQRLTDLHTINLGTKISRKPGQSRETIAGCALTPRNGIPTAVL